MALKRVLVGDYERNQRLKLSKYLLKDDLLQKYSAQLENNIRKMVREEAEQAVLRSIPSSSSTTSIPRALLPNEGQQSESKKFNLRFEGKLPGRLYTGNSIEAEGPVPVKLELHDALSGRLVTNGYLSSLKVEIVALHGHFKAEQLEDWTQGEFDDHVVVARDGKRPLLVGEHVIALQNGVGFIDGIYFTDNSSWVRSKMFRLGARVFLAKDDQVKAAVSGPFEVKDRRGENYQKHATPSLEDDVWRLHKIAKDGKICQRLAEHQIFKVRDFLKQYQINQPLLRQILNVSPKVWEVIVQQATSCLSSNVYLEELHDLPISQKVASNLDLHQSLYVPAPNQGEAEILNMSYNQVMTSLNHEGPALAQQNPSAIIGNGNSSFGPSSYTDPLYEQDMFNNVPAASNWDSIAQSSHTDHLGMSIPSPLNMQDPAIPKAGWSTIRAV